MSSSAPYWGASLTDAAAASNDPTVTSAAPYPHPPDVDGQKDGGRAFTPPPSADGSRPPYIDDLHLQLMAERPADVSVQADEWQNVVNLLTAFGTEIRQQAEALQDAWHSTNGSADEFLRRGPGTMLLYLDSWRNNAQSRVTGLRQLAEVITDTQNTMSSYWQQYLTELYQADLQNSLPGPAIPVAGPQPVVAVPKMSASDQMDALTEIRNRWSLKAQQLAYATAQRYIDIQSSMLPTGLLYYPPNVVLTMPGMPPLEILLPGGPAGLGAPAPPVPPNPPAPPAPPALPPPPAPPTEPVAAAVPDLPALALPAVTAASIGTPPDLSDPPAPQGLDTADSAAAEAGLSAGALLGAVPSLGRVGPATLNGRSLVSAAELRDPPMVSAAAVSGTAGDTLGLGAGARGLGTIAGRSGVPPALAGDRRRAAARQREASTASGAYRENELIAGQPLAAPPVLTAPRGRLRPGAGSSPRPTPAGALRPVVPPPILGGPDSDAPATRRTRSAMPSAPTAPPAPWLGFDAASAAPGDGVLEAVAVPEATAGTVGASAVPPALRGTRTAVDPQGAQPRTATPTPAASVRVGIPDRAGDGLLAEVAPSAVPPVVDAVVEDGTPAPHPVVGTDR